MRLEPLISHTGILMTFYLSIILDLQNFTIRTHWYADDLLKQCPSKGDKYVIDEELQHTPHDKLKTRLKETIHKAFSHRNYGSKFVVLDYKSTYFSNKIHKGKTCYSEEQVISMLEFLIDNIFGYIELKNQKLNYVQLKSYLI
jgi:hypothetical protein